MNTMIQVEHLNRIYNTGAAQSTPALRDICMSVQKGEFLAVMGPSGSGKSTLLYNISGIDRADSGSVIFGGKELVNMSEKEKTDFRLTKMGFVFQNIYLLKNLNLLDNVILPAVQAKKLPRSEIKKRGIELMRKMGIESLKFKNTNEASGGQLQRVGICRALINNPDVIFGDEPTGALDSKSTRDIMNIFHEINLEGTTIILVTHDSKVAAVSDRVLFILDGRISSEKYLGKYDGDDKARNSEIEQWLHNNGF